VRKAERRKRSPDGLPVDAREWTVADWQVLHEAMEAVKRKVAKRHERPDDLCDLPTAGPSLAGSKRVLRVPAAGRKRNGRAGEVTRQSK
jgi:hypothetical protein